MYKLFRLSFLMIILISATVFVKSANIDRSREGFHGLGPQVPAELVDEATNIGVLRAQLKGMEAQPDISKEQPEDLRDRISRKERKAELLMDALALPGYLKCQVHVFKPTVDNIADRAEEEELARGRDQENKEKSEFRGKKKPSPLKQAQWSGYNQFWHCAEERYRELDHSEEEIVSIAGNRRFWNSYRFDWFWDSYKSHEEA